MCVSFVFLRFSSFHLCFIVHFCPLLLLFRSFLSLFCGKRGSKNDKRITSLSYSVDFIFHISYLIFAFIFLLPLCLSLLFIFLFFLFSFKYFLLFSDFFSFHPSSSSVIVSSFISSNTYNRIFLIYIFSFHLPIPSSSKFYLL